MYAREGPLRMYTSRASARYAQKARSAPTGRARERTGARSASGLRTTGTASRAGAQRRCPRTTSAPGLGSPLPHLHRDWARPCHICTGTGTSAQGPDTLGPHRTAQSPKSLARPTAVRLRARAAGRRRSGCNRAHVAAERSMLQHCGLRAGRSECAAALIALCRRRPQQGNAYEGTDNCNEGTDNCN